MEIPPDFSWRKDAALILFFFLLLFIYIWKSSSSSALQTGKISDLFYEYYERTCETVADFWAFVSHVQMRKQTPHRKVKRNLEGAILQIQMLPERLKNIICKRLTLLSVVNFTVFKNQSSVPLQVIYEDIYQAICRQQLNNL